MGLVPGRQDLVRMKPPIRQLIVVAMISRRLAHKIR
jgi:hypothetical protein